MKPNKEEIRSLHKQLEYYLVSYRRDKNNKGVKNGMIGVHEDKDIEQLYWLVHNSDLVSELKMRLLVRIVDNFMNEYALKELTGINTTQNALDNKLNYKHEQFYDN
jgi:hypothetical protein|tara:strand:- start:136 stop:453 length:318 start_codon:yes stop_codon:yes gene_type:complete